MDLGPLVDDLARLVVVNHLWDLQPFFGGQLAVVGPPGSAGHLISYPVEPPMCEDDENTVKTHVSTACNQNVIQMIGRASSPLDFVAHASVTQQYVRSP